MPGAQHRRKLLFAPHPVGQVLAEGTEAALAGERQRGAALLVGRGAHLLAQILADSRSRERLMDPARTEAAPQQAAGAGAGEGLVVDVTKFDETPSQRLDRGVLLSRPAALAQLAAQVVLQFRPARREARDIGQRQLFEPCRVERFGDPLGPPFRGPLAASIWGLPEHCPIRATVASEWESPRTEGILPCLDRTFPV